MAENVFSLLMEKNSDGVETKVRVTYLELYMEQLQDLLESHNTDKELFISKNDKGNTGNENISLTIVNKYGFICLCLHVKEQAHKIVIVWLHVLWGFCSFLQPLSICFFQSW